MITKCVFRLSVERSSESSKNSKDTTSISSGFFPIRSSLRKRFADSHRSFKPFQNSLDWMLRWETHPWKSMQRKVESSSGSESSDNRGSYSHSKTMRRNVGRRNPDSNESSKWTLLFRWDDEKRRFRYETSKGSSIRRRSPFQEESRDNELNISSPVLQNFTARQTSGNEMDWGVWDVTPSSPSLTSASLTSTQIENRDNLLSVASSAATSDSTTGSEDSTLHPSVAKEIADLACPIPDESVTVDQYGFILREGEERLPNVGVDPAKVKRFFVFWKNLGYRRRLD